MLVRLPGGFASSSQFSVGREPLGFVGGQRPIVVDRAFVPLASATSYLAKKLRTWNPSPRFNDEADVSNEKKKTIGIPGHPSLNRGAGKKVRSFLPSASADTSPELVAQSHVVSPVYISKLASFDKLSLDV